MTDEEDAIVPEIGDSFTSVTWNEELMDDFDGSSEDKIVDKNTDVRCNSSTLPEDVNHLQPQTNVRQNWPCFVLKVLKLRLFAKI